MKRFLSVLLVLLMLFGCTDSLITCSASAAVNLPPQIDTISALATNVSSSFVINEVTLPFANTTSDGVISSGTVKDYNGGSGCWALASYVYRKLFDKAFNRMDTSDFITQHGKLISLTAANLKEWVLKAGPGAIVRFTPNTTWVETDSEPSPYGHSIVVVDANDTHVWIYHAAGTGVIYGNNHVQQYTWQELTTSMTNSGKKNIRYIKYPGKDHFDVDFPYTTQYMERAVYKGDGTSNSVKAKPYAGSDVKTIESYTTKSYTVVAAVKNKYDNIWYQTVDGHFIYSGDVTYVSSDAQITTSSLTIPSGTLQKGQTFGIKGTIKSSDSIIKAEGAIYSGSTVKMGPFTDTFDVSACKTSFDLYSSNINNKMKFGTLAAGNYTLKIKIYYGTHGLSKEVINTSFTIAESTSSSDQWIYEVAPTTTWGLNMRSSASTSGSIVTTLQPGARITITGTKVNADGYTWGYGKSSTGYTGWVVVDNSWTTLISSPSSNVKVTGITLNSSNVTLDSAKGQTTSLSATITPSTASNKNVTWQSSNTSVATVSASGIVTPKSAGSAIITCTAADGSGVSSSCKITVINSAMTVSHTQTHTTEGAARLSFTIKSSTNAAAIGMYAENGSLVKKFSGSSLYTDSNGIRTWKINYDFSNDGNRTMTFKALNSSGSVLDSKSYSMNIVGLRTISAAFSPATVIKGASATATVRTNIGAQYLIMYSENGAKVKAWPAGSYSSVSGGVRIWTVQYAFSGAGSRKITFKASLDGTTGIGSGKTAAVTVKTAASVNSAAFTETVAYKNQTITITATTSSDAQYLHMYSEAGALVKTWNASGNSSINDNTRTWTLKYSFSGGGLRRITFKASSDGTTVGTGKTASIVISASGVPAVGYAKFVSASALRGESVIIVVKTNSDAKQLAMLTEAGARAKTWNANGNSVVNGNERIWTVTYTFNGAGNRKLTFRSSKDGSTFGYAQTAAITIK